jgi:hypothetical protein|tara:strand:- start:93 stop:533 length:441 start_codon:yes stop_codon:yes gene_type:complete
MATDNLLISINQTTNAVGQNLTKSTTITGNSLSRCSFKMASDKEILVISISALRTGLKYIGMTSDVALTGAVLRDSTATGTAIGSGTVLDIGAFTAGQAKQSESIDFALPSSGNNIDNLRITKATDTGEATVSLEIYSSETITEAN